MGQFEVTYSVNAEFVQYLDDITVDEIDINLLSVREGGFHSNGTTITGLKYECYGCNESITADMTPLVPTNITQCNICNEVVCDKCIQNDQEKKIYLS